MTEPVDTSPEAIERFLALAEKATEGPWDCERRPYYLSYAITSKHMPVYSPLATVSGVCGDMDNAADDAAFIAAARTMAPALAEEVRRLRSGLAQIKQDYRRERDQLLDIKSRNDLTEHGEHSLRMRERFLAELEALKGAPT